MPDLTLWLVIECALLLPLGFAFARISAHKGSPDSIDRRWLRGWAALVLSVAMLLVDRLYPSTTSPAGLIALVALAVYAHVLLLASDRYLRVPRTPADLKGWDALCIGLVILTALLHIPSVILPPVRVLPVVVLVLITHIAPLAMLPSGAARRGKAATPAEATLCLLLLLWGLRVTVGLLLSAFAKTVESTARAGIETAASAASLAGIVILLLFTGSLFSLRYQYAMEHNRRIRHRYDSMFEHNTAVLLLVRCDDGSIIDVNPSASVFYGYDREILSHMTLHQLSDIPAEKVDEALALAARVDSPQQEYHHRLADGTRRYVRVTCSRILEDGCNYALYTVTDLSSLRAEAEQAAFLTMHDQLTGLYNRNWIHRHILELEARMSAEASPSGPGPDLTVLTLDINNLHTINELHGVRTGDQVLVEFAEQLRQMVPPRTPVIRSGGDEFILLLHDIRPDQVYTLVRRLELVFHSHPRLGFPIGLSSGLATTAECGDHLQEACALAENRLLEDKLNRNDSLMSAPIQTLLALLRERYIETEEHALRLKDLSLAMARAIDLPASQFANLELLANLHDIGKIAISESILLKAGPLDDTEWTIMRQHPDIGARIVSLIPHASSISEDIRSHHERWDGNGYPRGLAGEDIPLLARIVSLADAWDAMTHDRPYKSAMKWTDAIREIDSGRGWQFDPRLTDVFLRMVGG